MYKRWFTLLMSLDPTLMHPNFRSCSLGAAIYKRGQVLGEIRGEEQVVNEPLWLISATVSLIVIIFFFLKTCVGSVKICSWPGTGTLEQCFSTGGPRPGTGLWHKLCRAARGSPGICHFSFQNNFHE